MFDRAGLWLNLAADGFEVMDVIAGGPAARAGLGVGDRIVAVNGRPASGLSLPALRVRFKTDPPGTRVRLRVVSGGKQRQAVLVLCDLV